jgi:hypothetical protein
MRFNAILLIFLILSILVSGCDLFKEKCETHCHNDVIYHCSNDGGLFGGTDDWYTEDCKEDGLMCLEKGNTAYCIFKSDRCNASTESFCIDENASAYCIEKNGKFFASNADSCYLSSNETCVEFDNEARCVIPVEKCNSKAEKVCFENSKVNCYEKDGSYYIEKNYYDDDCDEGEECVELDNERTYCLTPTEFCFVSENSICINDRPAVCYEKDGRFFMSYIEYCYSDTVCVEFKNRDAECLIMISSYCDPEAESVCYGDAIATCYENDGFYYVNIENYCQRNADDKCIYDSSTKKAECLSDSDSE